MEPESFEQYLEGWSSCSRCSLSETRKGRPVFGKGAIHKPGILFVGEAPGGQEEIENEVFVGRTGQMLFDVLWMLDIDHTKHRYTNVVMCRPPDLDNPKKNRSPTPAEIGPCKERLLEEIYYCDPYLVVALGGTASKALGGSTCSVTAYRGEFVDISIPSRVQGSLTYPMLVTWHPAHVLRRIDYRIGDNLPVIDNFAKIFFSEDPFEQLVRDIAIAQGTYDYLKAAYARKKTAPETVSELAVMLT